METDRSEHYSVFSDHQYKVGGFQCRCGFWCSDEKNPETYVWKCPQGWEHRRNSCFPVTDVAIEKLHAHLKAMKLPPSIDYQHLYDGEQKRSKTLGGLLEALHERFLTLEKRIGGDRSPTDAIVLAAIEEELNLDTEDSCDW